MSAASDLIERMERETGQRIDDNEGDNLALVGLFGAIVRIAGKSSHNKRDDAAVGVIAELLASMLLAGFSPEEICVLTKN